jgi:trans-2,3-dihydro-3-hydroxyanthranilate isomerase
LERSLEVTFEEKAGLVRVTIQKRDNGRIWCELTAPEKLSFGKTARIGTVASALSLSPGDIVTTTHDPCEASVGLPFLFVELATRAALERARIDMNGFAALRAEGVSPDVHFYVRTGDGFDVRARMFAPFDGVPEDPATGSANCALAGLLSHYSSGSDGMFHWRIAQGVEMGRPSVLEGRAEKRDGVIVSTWTGGASVFVSEGMIEVD